MSDEALDGVDMPSHIEVPDRDNPTALDFTTV